MLPPKAFDATDFHGPCVIACLRGVHRCNDEFGQLSTRVKGVKMVRDKVAEGWKGRTSCEAALRQPAGVGGALKEGLGGDGTMHSTMNKRVKQGTEGAEDAPKVHARREGVKHEDLGSQGTSAEATVHNAAQRSLAKRAKAPRDPVADGWRNRGKGFVSHQDALDESEPEEGAIEDVPQKVVVRKASPNSSGFRVAAFRGATSNR